MTCVVFVKFAPAGSILTKGRSKPASRMGGMEILHEKDGLACAPWTLMLRTILSSARTL